jgi:hypothetical protein
LTAERRKPQTGKQLLLRFAEGSDLRERLDQIARANGRSTTSEVLLRLEASLQAEEQTAGLSFVQSVRSAASKAGSNDPDLEARVSELEKAVRLLKQAQSSSDLPAACPDA